MLIRFIIENFKSYEKETTFEMVASGKYKTHIDHVVKNGPVDILKHGVIFGPNASGKSKLIDAFFFFKDCLLQGSDMLDTTDLFCKNREENRNRNTSFEIQLSIGDAFYAYGFSIIMDTSKITEEWLFELGKTGTRKAVFTRDEMGVVNYVPLRTLPLAERTRFSVYQSDFEGNTHRLFLSEMNRNKKIEPTSRLFQFVTVFDHLVDNIIVVNPNTTVTNFQRYYDEATLEHVNDLLQTFDTGISKIVVEETSLDEIKRRLPSFLFDELMKDMKERIAQKRGKDLRFSMRIERDFFNIYEDSNANLKVSTLRTEHRTSTLQFRFAEESDGTQRLFELLDILLMDSDEALFVIDELDRSLHPMLTWRFLEQFNERNLNRRRQLAFTTHEPYIMDQKLYRLDEIWFVEKDKDDSSIIYSLDRFKERTDKVISKTYLEGRYGAVPILSQLDNGYEPS